MSINPISAVVSALPHNDPSLSPFGINANALDAAQGTQMPTIGGAAPHKSFSQTLTDAIAGVNDAQLKSLDMTARFAAGEPMDIHQVMIASQEANVALNLALQVRNKLVDAYTEIMHVSV